MVMVDAPVWQTDDVRVKRVVSAQGTEKDRDQDRVRRQYLQLSREELANRLLLSEQQYAELHERWLTMHDNVLEWQLRAEQAEVRFKLPANVGSK